MSVSATFSAKTKPNPKRPVILKTPCHSERSEESKIPIDR